MVAVRNSNDAVGWQSGGGLGSAYQPLDFVSPLLEAVLERSLGGLLLGGLINIGSGTSGGPGGRGFSGSGGKPGGGASGSW